MRYLLFLYGEVESRASWSYKSKTTESDDEGTNNDGDDTNVVNDENAMNTNEQPTKSAGRSKRGAKTAAADAISSQINLSVDH